MEVQLAVKGAKSNRHNTPPNNHSSGDTKAIPNYLKPSTGSCHHACKYGGTHKFEQKDEAPKVQPKPRKQQPPAASDHHKSQKRTLIRVRLVPRNLFGDFSRGGNKVEKAAAADKEKEKKKAQSVEWKDIVAYDTVPEPAHGALPELEKPSEAQVIITGSSGDVKKRDATRGKKSYEKANITEQVDGVKSQNDQSLDKKTVVKPAGSKMTSKVSTEPPTHKNTNTETNKSTVKPPKGKKPTALAVKKKDQEELVDGYQPLSPSLLQKRASLLRDLEEEMVVHEATNAKKESETTYYSLDQEEFAAAEETRPIPAHRRVKSTSLSSRSVRFPFARQASKNSATFKLRSKSSKGPILPPSEEEEEKPARLRSRRGGSVGGDSNVGSTGRGIQLRIRSLRRRGVGGASAGGFVVPAVSLRHQKTLEKKKSQRLYNNVIEETASKLVKARKSRVKALVGAFESVISKIAK